MQTNRKNSTRRTGLVFLLVLALLGFNLTTAQAAGPLCYVNASAGGANDGASWTAAYTDLQSALAGLDCDEIWVAAGTYKPTSGTDRAISFALKSGVAIYGGFSGTETARDQRNSDPASNNTVLSGDIGTPNDKSDNSYHVVTGSSTDNSAVLDGFTITAGYTAGNVFPTHSGAGMYNDGGSPAVANVIFSGNFATQGGGMFNHRNSSPTLTNVTFSSNTGSKYGGGMFNAGASPSLTDVTFSSNSAGLFGGGMYNTASSPALMNVTFSDNSAGIQGGGMFNTNSSPALTNVTFSGNSANEGGGMLNSHSSPALTDVTFSGNRATGTGGGMYNSSSNPELTNVTFSGNQATSTGGGMYNETSSPALTNATFSDNSAGAGGGMFSYSSNPELTNVTFSGNQATEVGGGMYNETSSPKLTNVTFSDNSAGNGGGLYTVDGTPALIDVTFSGNSARSNGGGMYIEGGDPALTDVIFSGNQATKLGGGMYIAQTSSPTLMDVTFSGNSAASDGGGIYNTSSPTLTNVTFSGNSAASDGGGMVNSSNSPTLTNVTFSSNSAGNAGGGMVNSSSSPTLTNVTFSGNQATNYGGGIYNYSSSPTLTNVTFSGNQATNYGGGMYNYISSPTLTNVTFSSNSAGNAGGGMANSSSSPTLINVIIANSSGGDCVNFGDVGSLNAASANNLIEDAAHACGLTDGVAGNIIGSDPNLAPLADNGGTTQTHALLAGSPAIDAGDDANCPSTDQRGQARPQGSHCDIGAFEAAAPADTTPPVVSADVSGTLGDNGWYVGDVSLSWSVLDDDSAITSSTGCDPLSITSDQPETAYTCEASSAGGTNSATANIKRDATPPAVDVRGVTDGATYVLGSVPTAGCDTSDAVSGVATAANLSVSGGNALGVGSFTAACDGARDNAGNAAHTASVHYTVIFLFTGFSAPIDNNGILNIARAGQPIPLKWRITDANGSPVTTLTSVSVTATSLACSTGTTTDQVEEYATGASGLQNLGNGYYQWNWKSPTSYANSCKTLKLDLGEGAGFEHVALFQFKK